VFVFESKVLGNTERKYGCKIKTPLIILGHQYMVAILNIRSPNPGYLCENSACYSQDLCCKITLKVSAMLTKVLNTKYILTAYV